MAFLLRKAMVGFIALVTSIIPVVEIGIFGYEAWSASEDRSQQHQAAGEELAAFREDLELQALANAQMEDGQDRQWAVDNWNSARGHYESARGSWQDEDYAGMEAEIRHGRDAMAGVAGDWAGPVAMIDSVEDPAFPLLVTGATGLLAVIGWGTYMGIQARPGPATRGQHGRPGARP